LKRQSTLSLRKKITRKIVKTEILTKISGICGGGGYVISRKTSILLFVIYTKKSEAVAP
jgi:hypothetical protein